MKDIIIIKNNTEEFNNHSATGNKFYSKLLNLDEFERIKKEVIFILDPQNIDLNSIYKANIDNKKYIILIYNKRLIEKIENEFSIYIISEKSFEKDIAFYIQKKIIILNNPDKKIIKKIILELKTFDYFTYYQNNNDKNTGVKISNYIDSIFIRKKINLQTASKFGFIWTKNIIMNSIEYVINRGVDVLYDSYKDQDVIIIGAGASLYYNIEKLKKNWKKFIIISVDTAVRPLLKNGITPDIIVTFDSQSINAMYIKNLDLKNSIIITSPVVNNIIVKKFKNNILFTSVFFELIKEFEKIGGKKFELGTGGTVTSSAYDFAKFIGSKHKFFMGLDLCYSYFEVHSKNSLYEDIFYYIQDYYETYESKNIINQITSESYFSHDVAGRKVRTDVKFKVFGEWFKNEIDENTFFLGDRNLFIEGIKNIDFEVLNDLGNHKKADEYRNYLKKFINNNYNKSNELKIKSIIRDYLDEILNQLEIFKELLNQQLNIIKKIKDLKKMDYKKNIDHLLITMDIYDKKILEYKESFKLINILSQRIINKAEYEINKMDPIEFSEIFYNELKNDILKIIPYINFVLKN